MSRRGRPVPEAAPVVGVVLAFSAVLYGYLFAPEGTLLPVFLVALLTLYAFTAFAVVRTDAPASVLRPDAVLAAGFILAVLAGAYGLAVAGKAMFAAFIYRETRGPPMDPTAEATLVAACLGGGGLAVVYFVLVAGRAATGVLVGAGMLVVGTYFSL